MKHTISVVIPTYKNPQFEKNLQENLPFLEGCQVIVVNDNPENDLSHRLDHVPVTLLELPQNKGFAGAVNVGITQATGKYILLLNDDVILKDQSFKTAVTQFEKDPKLFAVAFAQEEANSVIGGKNHIYWENGFFRHSRAPDTLPGDTGWAEGGSSLFDSEKLKKLGGFDGRYSPFYWEDIDLSYRAKEQGYHILFDPSIKVEHHHETTIHTHFSQNNIKRIAFRNQLLFTWTHAKDTSQRLEHRKALIKLLIQTTIKGDFSYIKGFLQAVSKYSNKSDTINYISD